MITFWNINTEALNRYLSMVKESKDKQSFDFSRYVHIRRPMTLENGIATIHVNSYLLDNAVPIDKELGVTDYRDVIGDINAALSQDVQGILLDVDSPGGTVVGCAEAAEAIANAPVPVVAYVDGLATSAAYYLAVTADHIIARPSASVGNIGTILVLYDDSKMLATFGVERIVLTNDGADYKSIGYELTESQREFLQSRMDVIGANFRAHVEANRCSVNPEVYKAGWYEGQDAIDLGLIEETGDRQLALQRLAELIDLARF